MQSVEDDHVLAQQARQDPRAFACLYNRYIDRIHAYAFRQAGDEALAQEVTSSTFEKALRHIRRRGWQGGSLCAWLYRIARNELIWLYRKQRWFVPLRVDLPDTHNVEVSVQESQEIQSLHSALGRLSGRDREILTLRYLEELSSEDVAEILGCSRQNLYVNLHRALKRLRQELDGTGVAGLLDGQGEKTDV